MQHRLGLKLWSSNTDNYFPAAQKLFEKKIFDYIELYVVPNTLETLDVWSTFEGPFQLHAPHFMHGINLADPAQKKHNKDIFGEVREFQKRLCPQYVVVHSGMNGSIHETAKQLNALSLDNVLIENKPFIAPFTQENICRGATYEEIAFVLEECGVGLCLDIGHALCAANSLKELPYAYLEKFQTLSPSAYHLSGNFIQSEIDSHLHLKDGDYDYKKILSIIDVKKDIAIETTKDSTENLDDFVSDVEFLKNILATLS